jgi:HlyD family secretion protein
VRVASRLASRVLVVHAREGDTVKAGQLLVELDCAEPEALLAQARAQLKASLSGAEASRVAADASSATARAARQAVDASGAQLESLQTSRQTAEREAARLSTLNQAGAIASSSLDRAQDQVQTVVHQLDGVRASQEAARAQASAAALGSQAARVQAQSAESAIGAAQATVDRVEALAKECQLAAPRDGVVLVRSVEPGEAVLPGSHLLTLMDLREAEVTFYLPNAELAAAAPGKPVSVRADAYPDLVFPGVIVHVSPQAEFTPRNVQTREDRDRLVYGVKVRIPNPEGKLRAGMPADVRIDGTGK